MSDFPTDYHLCDDVECEEVQCIQHRIDFAFDTEVEPVAITREHTWTLVGTWDPNSPLDYSEDILPF